MQERLLALPIAKSPWAFGSLFGQGVFGMQAIENNAPKPASQFNFQCASISDNTVTYIVVFLLAVPMKEPIETENVWSLFRFCTC